MKLCSLTTALFALAFTPPTLVPTKLCATDDNVLENGDFESGGKLEPTRWMKIWPRSIQVPEPEFAHPDEGAHGGKSCATIETFQPGGYTSFTQEVSLDSKYNVVALRGWVRVDAMAEGSSASFMLLFMDDSGEMISMHATPSVASVGEWKQLETEVSVPDETSQCLVRCGVAGQATVAFDDVELVGEEVRGTLLQVKLAVHHGTYKLHAPQACKEPSIALSIPFPFARQTPLAVRVVSDPPEQVARLEIVDAGENRPLRVVLLPQERGADVSLRIETLVMVADRPLSDGVGVELPDARRAPKEVKPFLETAPGLDLEFAVVQQAVKSFDKTDLSTLMRDVTAYLKKTLKYEGGGNQGAKQCLESGKAVCTGFANVAATLLIATGAPTRILASTTMSGRLQEHYIVETWTQELGWSRLESTMALFPLSDTNNLILRVVEPSAFRSSGNVPLFVKADGGATGGFDASSADTCWQGAETLASLQVQSESFTALEAHTRKSFDGLLKRPVKGASANFLPDTKAHKKLKLDSRTERLLTAADAWLK